MTELGAVAETALWTLHHRAAEATRPGGVIRDPMAISLVEGIDHPFGARFGDDPRVSQWQALRALTFDREVARFARDSPGGTVVALGEGLETQFWRVDDGCLRWVTVDVPEILAMRERLLPPSPRRRDVAGSALDPAWAEGLGDGPVLVTAQGLLMYLERDEAFGLVRDTARRLPGAAMVFDAAPRWLAERSMRGAIAPSAGGYVAPPWRWGWDAAAEREMAALPGVAALDVLHPPRGRGALLGGLLPAMGRVPPLRRLMLNIHRARFARA